MPRSKLGSLRERNGRWQSQIRNPRTGDTEATTWPADLTKTEINRRHHAWCLGILNRTQATSRDPLADHLHRWLEAVAPTVSTASADVYRKAVNRIIKIAGDVKLKDVDPQLIDHIISELRAAGYSHSTITNTKSVLGVALDRAVQWNLLPSNPAKVVKVGRRPAGTPGRDPKVVTTDELDRIIAAETSVQWRAHWQALKGTGCRPGELLAARWGDLDLTAGVFRVERTVTKDAAGNQIVGDETKTRRRRQVTIDAETVAALRVWRQELAGRSFALVAAEADVWPSPQKLGEPLQAVTVFYAWKAACRRAGVSEDRTLHGVRHWHASTLMSAGVHAKDVAERLGHSINETMGRYGIHAPPGERRIEQMLPGNRKAEA